MAVARDPKAMQDIRTYLDELATANVDKMTHVQKVALWCNAYNVMCINFMLQHVITSYVHGPILSNIDPSD